MQTIEQSIPILPATEEKSYHMVFHEHLTSALQAAGFSMKYLISSSAVVATMLSQRFHWIMQYNAVLTLLEVTR